MPTKYIVGIFILASLYSMAAKVLIIRFSSIGDIVLTTPIIRCVYEQLDVEIHFLTKTKFKGILRHNPYISKLYSIDKDVTEVISELKSEQYDYIIDLHKNLRTQEVKLRLGVKSYSFDKLNVAKWMKVNLKINRLPDKHIVDRYFEGVSALNVTNDRRGLDYFISPSDQEEADAIIGALSKYNILVLGANYYTKRIPTTLSQKIIAKSEHPIVLLGGNDVYDEAIKLANLFPQETINLVGRTSLAASAGIIRHASEVHTGDTGLMHIASAYKKAIHLYWGSTIPEFGMSAYLPSHTMQPKNYEVHNLKCRPCSKLGYKKCPKGHFKCMLDIKI